jgi:hypothetical protein
LAWYNVRIDRCSRREGYIRRRFASTHSLWWISIHVLSPLGLLSCGQPQKRFGEEWVRIGRGHVVANFIRGCRRWRGANLIVYTSTFILAFVVQVGRRLRTRLGFVERRGARVGWLEVIEATFALVGVAQRHCSRRIELLHNRYCRLVSAFSIQARAGCHVMVNKSMKDNFR